MSQSAALDLYFWATPNGLKITIALAELGLDYTLIPVNISKGEQFAPDFLKISPNNRMPALVDREGPDGQTVSIFESGAILQYLARKTGQLYGTNEVERIQVEQWLMWQMGGLGPMAGQSYHFNISAPEAGFSADELSYGQARYRNEVARLYGVMERNLADGRLFMAGDFFSIADIAIWPWVRDTTKPADMSPYPHFKAWYARVGERPGVQRGMGVKVPEAA
ncbi:glutathione S-transferase family protein [Woodsholea maritima]|uniref:glutathione S-transferase family protein n=1 Tax=Woodsholea maritima TaxID=240237 RepID=UPI00036E8AC6|nr:glutathione S-transferase N-terminal domain-containing protein [Woodsholea maritima]